MPAGPRRPVLLRQSGEFVCGFGSAREDGRALAGARQSREPRPGSRVSRLCHRWTIPAAAGGRGNPQSLFADRVLATRLLDLFASRSTVAVVTLAIVEDAGLCRHAQLDSLH